ARIDGPPTLDDNLVRYTVFATDQDARGRLDAGYSNSDTVTFTGTFTPRDVPAPARGLIGAYTNGNVKKTVSYCIVIVGNVQVLGAVFVTSFSEQTNTFSCALASDAIDHLNRLRGQ